MTVEGTDAIGGGAGTDTVFYQLVSGFGVGDESDRMASPIVVTLDGMPNDGAAGENDAIASDVENVQSSVGADQITGDEGPNSLSFGADNAGGVNGVRSDLRGGPGADFLNAADAAEEEGNTEEFELAPTADAISCGPGQDQLVVDTADRPPADCEVITLRRVDRATTTGTLRSEVIEGIGGDDRIKALGGDDRVTGLEGDDRIDGGPGDDVLDGGPGGDVILARDATRDKIRCGPGRDTVAADRRDRVARDCERVRRR